VVDDDDDDDDDGNCDDDEEDGGTSRVSILSFITIGTANGGTLDVVCLPTGEAMTIRSSMACPGRKSDMG
jgi:hypothetical protein